MTDKWKKLEGREVKLKIENILGIFLTPQGWNDQNKKAKNTERQREREREREREKKCWNIKQNKQTHKRNLKQK